MFSGIGMPKRMGHIQCGFPLWREARTPMFAASCAPTRSSWTCLFVRMTSKTAGGENGLHSFETGEGCTQSQCSIPTLSGLSSWNTWVCSSELLRTLCSPRGSMGIQTISDGFQEHSSTLQNAPWEDCSGILMLQPSSLLVQVTLPGAAPCTHA